MKIVFMGTPQAAVPTLSRIIADGHQVTSVWTQPDRPSGRGQKLAASPVKEFALEHNIEVIQPTKIRIPETIERFKSERADLAVVVAYGRILPADYLTAFPYGAINVHFSLLPKLRGAAPVNWSIVNGDHSTGVTTMMMDEGLDTGDILLQQETEIGVNETSAELMTRLADLGADLLSDTLKKLNDLPRRQQDHSAATHAPMMQKPDGLIDWNKPADTISNQIRGFQPFPSSYTQFQEKKLTLWRAESADDHSAAAKPGTVIAASGNELVVQCGYGTALVISELQLEGKKRMAVRDFLNGIKVETGEILG